VISPSDLLPAAGASHKLAGLEAHTSFMLRALAGFLLISRRPVNLTGIRKSVQVNVPYSVDIELESSV
jgi:hypothetical protein